MSSVSSHGGGWGQSWGAHLPPSSFQGKSGGPGRSLGSQGPGCNGKLLLVRMVAGWGQPHNCRPAPALSPGASPLQNGPQVLGCLPCRSKGVAGDSRGVPTSCPRARGSRQDHGRVRAPRDGAAAQIAASEAGSSPGCFGFPAVRISWRSPRLFPLLLLPGERPGLATLDLWVNPESSVPPPLIPARVPLPGATCSGLSCAGAPRAARPRHPGGWDRGAVGAQLATDWAANTGSDPHCHPCTGWMLSRERPPSSPHQVPDDSQFFPTPQGCSSWLFGIPTPGAADTHPAAKPLCSHLAGSRGAAKPPTSPGKPLLRPGGGNILPKAGPGPGPGEEAPGTPAPSCKGRGRGEHVPQTSLPARGWAPPRATGRHHQPGHGGGG